MLLKIFIQRATDPNSQQLTFSSYKNHNTAKALAGNTPSGAFSFISPLYGGSISDRELFVTSLLMEKLESGDVIMADKGFNVADILEGQGILKLGGIPVFSLFFRNFLYSGTIFFTVFIFVILKLW